jgi:hypothetical protein
MIARPKNRDKTLNYDLGIARSCCRKPGFIHARSRTGRSRETRGTTRTRSQLLRALAISHADPWRRVVDRNRPSNSGGLLYMTGSNWGPIDSLMVCKPRNT